MGCAVIYLELRIWWGGNTAPAITSVFKARRGRDDDVPVFILSNTMMESIKYIDLTKNYAEETWIWGEGGRHEI